MRRDEDGHEGRGGGSPPGGPAPAPGPGGYYTVKEVARRLRSSPRTVRDWIVDGCPTAAGRVRLGGIKPGRAWRVSEEDLVVFEARVRPRRGRPDLDLEGCPEDSQPGGTS